MILTGINAATVRVVVAWACGWRARLSWPCSCPPLMRNASDMRPAMLLPLRSCPHRLMLATLRQTGGAVAQALDDAATQQRAMRHALAVRLGAAFRAAALAVEPLHLLLGAFPRTSPPTPPMPPSISESGASLGDPAVALCNSARANACKRWHARCAGGVACRCLACHLSYGTRPLTRAVSPPHRTRRRESSRIVASHHGF